MSSKAVKDPQRVQKWYIILRRGMEFVLKDTTVKPQYRHIFDVNCRKALSAVLKVFDPKALTSTNASRKVSDDCTFKGWELIEGVEGEAGVFKIGTDNVIIQSCDINFKFSELQVVVTAALKTAYPLTDASVQTLTQGGDWKSFIFPLVSYTYKMLKAEKEVLFNDNQYAQLKGLGVSSAQLKTGFAVANRFRKSRPEIYGVLLNIMALWEAKVQLRESTQGRGQKRSYSGQVLSGDAFKWTQSTVTAYNRIMAKQIVGREQRRLLIEAFEDLDEQKRDLVIASLNVIKPRVIHKFVLLPELIMACEEKDLEGASFSGVYPVRMWNTFSRKTMRLSLGDDQRCGDQLAFHMMFQTVYSNLKVLDWMIGAKDYFMPRSEWPQKLKHSNQFNWGEINIRYASNPLKGAPVNLGVPQGSVNMLATAPSFGGITKKMDRTDVIHRRIEQAMTPVVVQTTGGYPELEKEILEYEQKAEEGTTYWHEVIRWFDSKGMSDQGKIDCSVNERLFFF